MKSFNRIKQLNETVKKIIENNNLHDVVVADIGTDHGYLSELLSRNKSIKKVIATDISQACLDKTNKLILDNNLDKIETRLGDGLEPIDRADIVVVAGVGGYEIIKMLSNQNITKQNKNKCNIFVFQPTKNFVELRKFLRDKNYEITEDFIIKSGGKFYPIILVNLSGESDFVLDIFNTYFGKDNDRKDKVFLEFLNEQISKLSFVENMSENSPNFDEELKIKKEIFNLAKSIVNENKGD